MALQDLLDTLGPEIQDPEEESFLLFSQSIPSHDLGFVDSKATLLELAIDGKDLAIHQSPTILSSNRDGGTTGAVVWKITPLFASWISCSSNLLFRNHVLDSSSWVIELGCGISGIIGLTMGQYVASYVLTDQIYVSKLLSQNLIENNPQKASIKGKKQAATSKKFASSASVSTSSRNVNFKILDWETDEVTSSLTDSVVKDHFDLVIACDCIYNDMLIKPLVQTCIDVCNLGEKNPERRQTIVIVAQQLRSDEVFESWLKEFSQSFRVWRMPDEPLIDGLKSDSGFVVHLGVLR
ncbi:hypothetical protein BJ875DRAFT_286005 [Amylocarpus encephaloides]|uniref:Diaminohydroxyphosphoribosylamino-pyrimidine deaminase n=1 Tax=Amylocarpus encephaloides TaxID=45428 RepID=A0A9P7YSE5_9HELO|nr:hypothetical protein BJ875DRAFT_286005 [Amylocarpus encephaloides]